MEVGDGPDVLALEPGLHRLGVAEKRRPSSGARTKPWTWSTPRSLELVCVALVLALLRTFQTRAPAAQEGGHPRLALGRSVDASLAGGMDGENVRET